MATDHGYSNHFYEIIRQGAQNSARVVVPLFLETYEPASVVDVGCGEGWWGKEFENRGCQVTGIDGDYCKPVLNNFIAHDIAQSLPDSDGYDLAVALEVAEHLPPERAASFISDLCELAPVVLFSAAIPNQGGVGHLNEQWPDYWVSLFEKRGFTCSGAMRWQIWNDDLVENWYRQNLIVATDDPQRFPEWFFTPLAEVFPVVHPVLFNART